MGWSKIPRILGCALMAALVITQGGCMSKNEVNRQALEKFEEKYGVDYEVLYTEHIGDSVENRDEIHVYVKSLMEEGESAVILSWEEKGEAKSLDNLFGYIIREDYEQSVKDVVNTQFADAKVYVSSMGSSSFDDSLGMDSTLEDAYAVGEKVIPFVSVVVYTDKSEEEFQNCADEIAQTLKDDQLYAAITYYAVTDQNGFENIDRMNCMDMVDMFAGHSVVEMPYDAYESPSFY
ncbi:MAG: hypothetical protein ACI4DO_00450 [Roseburia sp.]